eukprot:PhF_6_TR29313/c3_g2_i1/m.42999
MAQSESATLGQNIGADIIARKISQADKKIYHISLLEEQEEYEYSKSSQSRVSMVTALKHHHALLVRKQRNEQCQQKLHELWKETERVEFRITILCSTRENLMKLKDQITLEKRILESGNWEF